MSRHLGDRAEAWLANRLSTRPVQIVAKNYQCRLGEIDLVLLHDNQLIFTEVRCRRSHTDARYSLTRHKQMRLILAAKHYLAHHPHDGECRFDLVTLVPRNQQFVCEWHADAFTMS